MLLTAFAPFRRCPSTHGFVRPPVPSRAAARCRLLARPHRALRTRACALSTNAPRRPRDTGHIKFPKKKCNMVPKVGCGRTGIACVRAAICGRRVYGTSRAHAERQTSAGAQVRMADHRVVSRAPRPAAGITSSAGGHVVARTLTAPFLFSCGLPLLARHRDGPRARSQRARARAPLFPPVVVASPCSHVERPCPTILHMASCQMAILIEIKQSRREDAHLGGLQIAGKRPLRRRAAPLLHTRQRGTRQQTNALAALVVQSSK